MQNGDRALLRLGSRLATVVSEGVRQNFKFWNFFLILHPVTSVFLFLMLYFMLDGLILFRKGDFHGVRCL